MLNTIENRVIALAGIYQACVMVRKTAEQGKELNNSIETCINSLFKTESTNVTDVYGDLINLTVGLNALIVQLGFQKSDQHDMEVTRYVLALIYLERKISKNSDLMHKLSTGIQNASHQSEYFSKTHRNVIANLGELYQQTISTQSPTILVSGAREILSNPDNSNLVRTLLLAGIRSTLLWRQCEGHRWQFLFAKSKLINEAKRILAQLA